ncbi:rifin PIR protein, putative [Plasmodium reichenowi]|uniref:Rifin PIR protein, putative n=1 Tax=Plasmodium reichenowi TaxID=5854 RepID=A0A2P9D4N5_PLARE|nr:rifin PIR protein, putative [Plasmodium reichenowi]
MKVHYINILLFALPLNILLYNQRNHKSTTHHTQTNRSLCECDLYIPNYDNDPQMKEVMDNFNKQTQQRFEEYDERMVEKRKQCKDNCDKEIQKIILKDKLEKELMDKFATLQTDIQSDAIPTCVCEKTIADKVEKGCLRCGGVLGGGVMPGFGTIGGTALYALNQLKPGALAAAIKTALELNTAKISAVAEAAGIEAGKNAVIAGIIRDFDVSTLGGKTLKAFFTAKNYTDSPSITHYIYSELNKTCVTPESENMVLCVYKYITGGSPGKPVSTINVIGANVNKVVTQAKGAAAKATKDASESATAAIEAEQTDVINTIFMGNQTIITASIIAIVIVVLILVIIYLILRYRRKKKMKKKLQYIKLLEE